MLRLSLELDPPTYIKIIYKEQNSENLLKPKNLTGVSYGPEVSISELYF